MLRKLTWFAGMTACSTLLILSAPAGVAASELDPAFGKGSEAGTDLGEADARPAPAPDLRPAPPPAPRPVGACDGGRTGVPDIVRQAARNLTWQRVPYSQDPPRLADCSGMALRVLRTLSERCEGLVDPDPAYVRSAAGMADWYADRDQLIPVRSIEDIDAWLVPGALAFYSRPGSEPWTDRPAHHVGFVYSVERDEDGKVQSYRLFHGRQPGHPAGITPWHRRDASPPLGNDSEPLIGIAFVDRYQALDALALDGF